MDNKKKKEKEKQVKFMLERFYPTEYIKSVQNIDFQMYYDQGIRGFIFDIDNTLVPHGAPSTKDVVELFKKIHGIGIDTCLISNNKESRVSPFAYDVDSKFVSNAHKPSTKNYIKAMELMHTDRESTIFVGDQLFTDVYGANRAGIPSVLVKPINKKEEIQIVLKRYLEKIVLWNWQRKLKKETNVNL